MSDDVLLGTSGVGVCVSVVSNSPGIYYLFILFLCYIGCPPACPIIYSAYLEPTAARWSSGCRIESAVLTLIIFFHLKRAQFCSRCLLRFDPAFSGSRLVRVSFSSWEFMAASRRSQAQ